MIQRNCFALNYSWSSVLLIPHPPTQSSLTYQNWPFLLSIGDLIRWKLSCVFLIRDGVGSESSFQNCFSFSLPELQCPQWWKKKSLSPGHQFPQLAQSSPSYRLIFLSPPAPAHCTSEFRGPTPTANCIILFYASASKEPNEVRQVM